MELNSSTFTTILNGIGLNLLDDTNPPLSKDQGYHIGNFYQTKRELDIHLTNNVQDTDVTRFLNGKSRAPSAAGRPVIHVELGVKRYSYVLIYFMTGLRVFTIY